MIQKREIPIYLNNNNRTYNHDALKSAIDYYIKNSPYIELRSDNTGINEVQKDCSINLKNVCAKIDDINLDSMIAHITVLETPSGKLFTDMLETSNIKLKCRYAFNSNDIENKYENLKLISIYPTYTDDEKLI